MVRLARAGSVMAAACRQRSACLNVRLREVIALEQQWLARCLGERIREAVAKVQRGGVVAPAEPAIGLACHLGLLQRYRLDSDIGFRQEQLEVAPAFVAETIIDDDR